jgi:VanZ family protein
VNPADLAIKEDSKAQELYLKSHKQYQPGQQKERNYKLPFDKSEHVFGKSIGLI